LNYYITPPRVRFRVDADVIQEPRGGGPRIPQMIVQHLKNRFEATDVKKVAMSRSWVVEFLTGPGSASFGLVFRPKKSDKNEWLIVVAPPFAFRRAPDAFVELPKLCRAIHELLRTTPGISQIRWFFQGFGRYFGASTTPDELPWG
jgi:hypothetical protein